LSQGLLREDSEFRKCVGNTIDLVSNTEVIGVTNVNFEKIKRCSSPVTREVPFRMLTEVKCQEALGPPS